MCDYGRLCCLTLYRSACLLDICFVVDHSGSIRDTEAPGEDNWQSVLDFMANVVSLVNLGIYGTHVGSVMFGKYTGLSYHINVHNLIVPLPYSRLPC